MHPNAILGGARGGRTVAELMSCGTNRGGSLLRPYTGIAGFVTDLRRADLPFSIAWENDMDFAYLALVVALWLLLVAMAYGCERIGGPRQ